MSGFPDFSELALGDGHPAGTEAVVVFDLGNDECQIALDTGAQVVVNCSALEPVDVAEPSQR